MDYRYDDYLMIIISYHIVIEVIMHQMYRVGVSISVKVRVSVRWLIDTMTIQ